MAAWQQVIQRVNTSWRLLPRVQQILLLIAIIGIGGWLWFAPHSTGESWTPLFEDLTLSNDDINRIEIALAQSNIGKFHSQNQMVHVLPADRAKCLQVLAELDALPASLQSILDKPPASDPFATREDRRAMSQFNRKNRIRNMLAELPFVDQVRVELDQTASLSVYQNPSTTCAVSILAKQGLILTADQAHTIREMIVALVAGIQREEIFIIDLAAGTAIHDEHVRSVSASHNSLDRLRLRQDLQHRLETALAEYPGVKIEVTLSASQLPLTQESVSPQSQPGPMLQPTQESARAVSKQSQPAIELKPGSNGQASIKTLLQKPIENSSSSPQPLGNSAKANSIPLQPASHSPSPFGVAVKIPMTTLDSFIARESQTWASQNAVWAGDRDVALNRLKSRIQSDISKVLSESPIPDAARTPLAIDIIDVHPMAASQPVAFQIPTWLSGKPAGAILAVASGAMLIAFVIFTTTRRAAKRRALQENMNHTPELDTAPTTIELRQQIDRLIKNDPDTAARVIQQWIRKAG